MFKDFDDLTFNWLNFYLRNVIFFVFFNVESLFLNKRQNEVNFFHEASMF